MSAGRHELYIMICNFKLNSWNMLAMKNANVSAHAISADALVNVNVNQQLNVKHIQM